MKHIFLSYAHEDNDFAVVIIRELERAGIKVWIDAEKLRAGDEWQSAIDRAIRDASTLLVVMSPAAKSSEYVTYEWTFALGAGVRVIPLLFKPTRLHPRLGARQYLDFTNAAARPWSKLIQQLGQATVASQGSQSATETVDPQRQKLINDLKKTGTYDGGTRARAAKALGLTKDPLVVPLLEEALKDRDSEVRVAAADALAEIGDKKAVANLIRAAQEEVAAIFANDKVIRATVRALGWLGDTRAVPPLIGILRKYKEKREQYKRDKSQKNDILNLEML